MAQQVYRGNLSAKVFPFIAEHFGRSIIIPGPDQNFQRQLVSAEDMDKDRGIPQVYYCHNVMPSSDGFQSIGYDKVVIDTKDGFNSIFSLRDTAGNEVFFAHASDGSNYVLPFGKTQWSTTTFIPGLESTEVTVATINGQSYIYFSNFGCYLYDSDSNQLVRVTLSGLNEYSVNGITSSSGYMIAWTDNSIAWSSTVEHSSPTDPIDFVPSLETGAGGGSIEAAKGKITLCVAHYLGLIIYTTDNAVAALYSGNTRYPFNFREIVNSGGLLDSSLVSFDSGTGNHYAYTTSGLQAVSPSQTQTIFPEITDFIAGKYFEDFDETTKAFVSTVLTSPMKKAVNVISDRYLVVSYGISELTHALIYDIAQKRFGKIKHTHVSCFEWKQLGLGVEVPRQNIGFLQANGSVSTVDFSYGADTSNGVIILGKYQLSRARLLQLESVELENIKVGSNFSLDCMTSVDGKTLLDPIPGYLALSAGAYHKYSFRTTGINHTLLAMGSFYFSSIVLAFNIHGRR